MRRVVPVSDFEVAIGIASKGSETWLLLSSDAVFARLHLIAHQPPRGSSPGEFVRSVRNRLEGARLETAAQIGADRIAELRFVSSEGPITLVAELMGKHSNLILIDSGAKILACMKPVGISKSKRPIQTGRTYKLPPVDLVDGTSPSDFIRASPFLTRLVEADGNAFDAVERALGGVLEPVYSSGFGAYPIPVHALGYPDVRSATFSGALEEALGSLVAAARVEQAKRTLAGQLERVLLAREAALHDLRQAADTAARARDLQVMGELVLAFASSVEPGSTSLSTVNYQGNPIEIPLQSDLSPQENAQRYFDKAKRAKLGSAGVKDRIAIISGDAYDLKRALTSLNDAKSMDQVSSIADLAAARKWLNKVPPASSTSEKAKVPFEGHKIRTIEGPRGFKVLYGENASSNDYLTSRVAKPNDYWLHVRGATSAHVVIQTMNQPSKVGPDVLRFAAEVAYRNSTAKHSKHVPVDYTLKKYVRKPRGSAVGTAVYTHEKTIYVGE